MAEEHLPSEEELREALDKIGVADILLSALSTTASIGFRRVSVGRLRRGFIAGYITTGSKA